MAKDKKKDNIYKKRGCPTKYRPEYCQMIIDYFSVKPYKMVNKKRIPCDLPTLEGFANRINVAIDTLLNWRKNKRDFLGAIRRCKNLQKNILIINGLLGLYQSNFAIFVTSNLTKFRQKKDISGDIKKTISTNVSIIDLRNAYLNKDNEQK